MTSLHQHPPMTLGRVQARWWWLLPSAVVLFVLLAVGAAAESLPWDQPVTDAAVDARSPWRDDVAVWVSKLGSTKVVLAVAALAAAAAWPRCRRLAVVIIVVALARPLVEFGLKELIGRDRPDVEWLVDGRGHSFPSGHPFGAAASWGLLPLVAGLYTRRRGLWWAVAAAAWTVVVLVAGSRVWLGVHYLSDVVGGVVIAVIGVSVAERILDAVHGEASEHPWPCAGPPA